MALVAWTVCFDMASLLESVTVKLALPLLHVLLINPKPQLKDFPGMLSSLYNKIVHPNLGLGTLPCGL